VSDGVTVSVVVPPDEVRTCETTGEVATGRETVWPSDSVMVTEIDGELVKDEAEMEVTSTPDEVMDGVLEAGAGVYTVVVAPDGVV
jgi:hypothetical protein